MGICEDHITAQINILCTGAVYFSIADLFEVLQFEAVSIPTHCIEFPGQAEIMNVSPCHACTTDLCGGKFVVSLGHNAKQFPEVHRVPICS